METIRSLTVDAASSGNVVELQTGWLSRNCEHRLNDGTDPNALVTIFDENGELLETAFTPPGHTLR